MNIFNKSQKGEITTLMVLLGIGIMAVGIIAGKKLVEVGTRFLPKAQETDNLALTGGAGPGTYEENYQGITYDPPGAWERVFNKDAIGNNYFQRSNTPLSTATFKINGGDVLDLYLRRSGSAGKAGIYIDGVLKPIEDLYVSSNADFAKFSYDLSSGKHNIKIEVRQNKNVNSLDYNVGLDKFEVRLNPTPTPTPTSTPTPTLTMTPTPTPTITPTPTPTTTPSTTPTLTPTASPIPPGSGTGLRGDYFDNSDLTNLKLTRTDANVNFNWSYSPDPWLIAADTFSVRWTGQVQPKYTESYTFYTKTNDGARLWVNNQLLIDKWVIQSGIEWNGTIALVAGQKYDIRMEYFENNGNDGYSSAALSWSSPSQAKEIIPQSQLYPANTSPISTPTPTVTPTLTLTPTPTGPTLTPSPTSNPVPVGFWAFDEGSGNTVADSSGNGNNGTAIGTTIVDGKYGKARSFNGTSDYINIGTVHPFTGNFTIEAWVNFNQVDKTNGYDNAILGQGEMITSNGLHVGERRGKPYFGFYSNDLTGLTVLSANTWYHLAFVYDGASKKIYVNGTLDVSNSSSPFLSQLSNTRIGMYSWNTNYAMNGSIDDMRIYNYARTPAQIAADMNTSSPQTSSTISDNFDGVSLDTNKWDQVTSGGSTINQAGGKLVISIPDQTAITFSRINTKQYYTGDFSAEVDLVNADSGTMSTGEAAISFSNFNDQSPSKARISRYVSNGITSITGIFTGKDPINIQLGSNVGTVKAKIVRIGPVIQLFYNSGSGYQLLASEPTAYAGSGLFELYAFSLAPDFPAVTSTFDNFSALVNLTCSNGDLGNLNCDQGGLINETDLSILLANWRPTGSCTNPTPTPFPNLRSADITGDCKVDESDLSKLLANWKTQ